MASPDYGKGDRVLTSAIAKTGGSISNQQRRRIATAAGRKELRISSIFSPTSMNGPQPIITPSELLFSVEDKKEVKGRMLKTAKNRYQNKSITSAFQFPGEQRSGSQVKINSSNLR